MSWGVTHRASVYGENSFQSEAYKITSGPNSKLKTSSVSNGLVPDKDSQSCASNITEKLSLHQRRNFLAVGKFFFFLHNPFWCIRSSIYFLFDFLKYDIKNNLRE